MENIKMEKSSEKDLANIAELWNDGDVMKFVGFPSGLGVTVESLKKWLSGVDNGAFTEHYSIYHDEIGFCGESYYSVDRETKLGMLDIKLFSKARGIGIARYAFEYAIEKAFKTGVCTRVYVDPSRENRPAWELYKKLGFYETERPVYLEPSDVYLELTEEVFNKNRKHSFKIC